jgi:two-component sensor histidine kinase
VHRSAVRLAAEQANMRRNVNEIFIKLARRSQALVERQLRLLDTMESAETDPDQLANLFRLDHLATRLRRNDENLLVLAEGDSTRGWNQPVDLNTVALAATAEIERYTMIQSEITDSVYIVGYAVTDLVHLVAELLENAAAFSPPETTVTLHAQSTPDGGAEIVISDVGLGMSLFAMAEANRQLAMPASIDVSAAERMGLVVVGHLAKRHQIGVTLSQADPGVMARVKIPAPLVTAAPPELAEMLEPARFLRPADAKGDGETALAVKVRAADVLRTRAPAKNSVWWSKRDVDEPAAQADQADQEPEPQRQASIQVTSSGLPKRTRTTSTGPKVTVIVTTVGAEEVNPEETESMLSRLYQGVRRADSENTASVT